MAGAAGTGNEAESGGVAGTPMTTGGEAGSIVVAGTAGTSGETGEAGDSGGAAGTAGSG
ncbi:hypothetical protein ACFL5O_08270 [Myxococcota bacterium]